MTALRTAASIARPSQRGSVSAGSQGVFISAGEASGDHYGAQLIRELLAHSPGLKFFGLGGPQMRETGFDAVVHAESVAHMGITEVIRHAPHIYRQFQSLKRLFAARRPGVAVLIDFPDVNFRLAKEAKRLGIPVVWLVSPQLWAWKKRRLRWVQQRVTRMLVIFPFEEQFYRDRGVSAEFIGHPLAELPLPAISREQFGTAHGLDPEKHWIALLPGSRLRELRLNLPAMLDAAEEFGGCYEFVLPVAATLSREAVAHELTQRFERRRADSSAPLRNDNHADSSAPLRNDNHADSPAPPRITLVDDARAALFHARGSIVASGTATVQAALMGNPFVIVYRMSALSYAVAKRLVRVPFAGMPNLIAGREIVPELLQGSCTGPNIVAALSPLLRVGSHRDQAVLELAALRQQLVLPPARPIDTVGGELPNHAPAPENQKDTASAMARAARAVLDLLPK